MLPDEIAHARARTMPRETADATVIPDGWRTRQPGTLVWAALCSCVIGVQLIGLSFAFIVPRWRQEPHWSYSQAVLGRIVRMASKVMVQIGAVDSINLEPSSVGDRWMVIAPSQRDVYGGAFRSPNVEPTTIGATWYPRPPTHDELRHSTTKVLLWFHSGSFIYLSGRPVDSAKAAQSMIESIEDAAINDGQKWTIFGLWIQYRLAGCSNQPTIYPGPMQDALTGYLYLVHDLSVDPARIILGGDSSGGTMAVGLLRHLLGEEGDNVNLNEDRRQLTHLQPCACLLLSPSVDYSVEGDLGALGANRNAKVDYVDLRMLAWGTALFNPPPLPLNTPYLSPARHPFRTPVPLYVQSGGGEVLCDTIRAFCVAMQAIDGNQLEYFELPYAPHDVFAVGSMTGWRKEARQVCQSAARFVAANTTARRPSRNNKELPPLPIQRLATFSASV